MIKIKFKKDFSSPVFGNVYIGKEVTLKSDQAKKYIDSGMAEEVIKEAEQPKKVKNNVIGKSKRGKKPSKG